jgi:hypothetical protein
MSLSTIIVAVNARMISYRKKRQSEDKLPNRALGEPETEASHAG